MLEWRHGAGTINPGGIGVVAAQHRHQIDAVGMPNNHQVIKRIPIGIAQSNEARLPVSVGARDDRDEQ